MEPTSIAQPYQAGPTDAARSAPEFLKDVPRARIGGSPTKSATPFSLSLAGLAQALTLPLPIAILCAGAIVKVCRIFSVLPWMIRNYDFQCYYISALVLRGRLNPYTIDYRPFISALGLHLLPD